MATKPRNSSLFQTRLQIWTLLVVAGWATVNARAALIDFESTPAGVPSINDQILLPSQQYVFPGLQVSFGIDSNADNVLEPMYFEERYTQGGEPPNNGFGGFDAGVSGPDQPDALFASQMGMYFLRGPAGATDFGLFVITYTGSTVVTAASGEIWDIDGTAQMPGGPGLTEEYTVRAYDTIGNLLATQVSPLGVLASDMAPLDGRPWTFMFSGLSAGIGTITIDFTGTKPSGTIGLAFNNFDPTGVPEPGCAVLVAIAAMCVAWMRRCHYLGSDGVGSRVRLNVFEPALCTE